MTTYKTPSWRPPEVLTLRELHGRARAYVAELKRRTYDWSRHARPEQLEPEEPYDVWLIMAGRGWGKTRTGAETIKKWALARKKAGLPPGHYAVIAKTHREVQAICFEARSAGLLAVFEPGTFGYKKSPALLITLGDGTQIRAFSAEDPDAIRGYAFDGAWCVAEGEPVRVCRDDVEQNVPIESVLPGDLVPTRAGWVPVRAVACTGRDRETLRLVHEHGTLQATPDHRVWVEDRGWITSENVWPGDRLLAWTNLSQDLPPGSNGTDDAGTATSATATTGTGKGCSCTSPSGFGPTGLFRTATTFTTATTTARTTPLAISGPLTLTNTLDSMRSGGRTRHGSTLRQASRRGSGPCTCGLRGALGSSPAPSAAASSSRSGCEPSSAPIPVGERMAGRWQPSVVQRIEPAPRADVYDLAVDGEFVAGGVLIHNCDEYAAWSRNVAQDVFDQLWFCLREAIDPRVIVTTTPKNLPHVRALVEGPPGVRVHVTRGHTIDNLANLSRAAVQVLTARYEGTRLGKQELHGELLTDIEGAMLMQSWIDDGRRRVDQVPALVVKAIGVDPAKTAGEDSDLTGIITVGIDADVHAYVLNDLSGRYSPESWAEVVWQEAVDQDVDIVVVEDNVGGDMVESVLKAAWIRISQRLAQRGLPTPGRPSIVRVTPSGPDQSKWLRAQTIALLYEQSPPRVHHVMPVIPLVRNERGEMVPDLASPLAQPGAITNPLAELEDEATTWTGGKDEDSPDRVDAMVHPLRWLLFPANRSKKKKQGPPTQPASSARWATAGGRR